MRELRHDRDEREQRDPGREHRQTELRVAVQFPRLGSDVDHAFLSLRLRPGDDACVRRRPARGSRSSVAIIRIGSPSGHRFLWLFSALGFHSYGTAPPRARAEWAGAQQHKRIEDF